jgi:radical SAM protein with 4Fe4S-binding SPASM domain
LAGNGFAFVSHVGDVCGCGFLPLSVGNVRDRPFSELYRESPLFAAFRDPSRLGGACGACEFRAVCGGCRARAYAATGDPLAEEPDCAYEPPGWQRHGGRTRPAPVRVRTTSREQPLPLPGLARS